MRRRIVGVFTTAQLVCIGAALCGVAGCGDGRTTAPDRDRDAAVELTEIGSKVAAFCGDCHAVPSPDSFPRYGWRDEVELGYQFYLDSGRTDLDAPPMNEVVNYFQSQAPEELVFAPIDQTAGDAGIRFEQTEVDFPHSLPLFTAVSYFRWIPPYGDRGPRLVFCDMCAQRT